VTCPKYENMIQKLFSLLKLYGTCAIPTLRKTAYVIKWHICCVIENDFEFKKNGTIGQCACWNNQNKRFGRPSPVAVLPQKYSLIPTYFLLDWSFPTFRQKPDDFHVFCNFLSYHKSRWHKIKQMKRHTFFTFHSMQQNQITLIFITQA